MHRTSSARREAQDLCAICLSNKHAAARNTALAIVTDVDRRIAPDQSVDVQPFALTADDRRIVVTGSAGTPEFGQHLVSGSSYGRLLSGELRRANSENGR